jgi:8-oxo-dGTP pyrophosphatase MutT (NUDIX family)
MKPGVVRAIAVCVLRREDAILVLEGRDEVKRETFYRPLGGEIEFGEYSAHTIQREIWEEIGAEVQNLRSLGMLENVFIYNGEKRHEIVIIYEADFVDQTMYEKESLTGHEDDGTPFPVMWKPLEDFENPEVPLYPEGLLQLISDK